MITQKQYEQALKVLDFPEYQNCPIYKKAEENFLDPMWFDLFRKFKNPLKIFGAWEATYMYMSVARVVKVNPIEIEPINDQMSEQDPHWVDTFLRTARLPFPQVFLEFTTKEFNTGGILLSEIEIEEGKAPYIHAFPFIKVTGDVVVAGATWIAPNCTNEQIRTLPFLLETLEDEEDRMQYQALMTEALEITACFLFLLESSNVDLGQEDLPRQQRRDAARKSRKIADTVVVRRKASRARPSGAGTGREYSHQFEVSGHFKHFTKGPIFNAAPPEKKIMFQGKECVRVWTPPFVKGPEGAPFIPKVRDLTRLKFGS